MGKLFYLNRALSNITLCVSVLPSLRRLRLGQESSYQTNVNDKATVADDESSFLEGGHIPGKSFLSVDQSTFGRLSGDDPFQALQIGAEMLTALRNSTVDVYLADLSKNGGKEIVTAILRALVNLLPKKIYNEDWRMVVAKCAGEILRLLLIQAPNQEFVSQFCGFWQIIIAVLSSPNVELELSALLWTCAATMSPFLARSRNQEEIVSMFKLACSALNNYDELAADAAFFICGASRGYVSTQSPERDLLVADICASLSRYIVSHESSTRQASITALHYFGIQFPEIAGGVYDMVFNLVQTVTDESIGGLAAGTLHAIAQANPSALKTQEAFLLNQVKRVINTNGGQSAQASALLRLLAPSSM
jgi:hypothetical protein